MNYDKIYKQIINFRKENPLDKDQYGENHHIIPRSLGGSDDKENLIRLTAREHFICHMLLAEMYPKETFEWYKMNHAFMQMKAENPDQIRYINSRYYELKRKDFGKTMSFNQTGSKNSNYGMVWIHSAAELNTIKVHKSLLSDYLERGYKIGRVLDFVKHAQKEKNIKLAKLRTKKLQFNGVDFSNVNLRNQIIKTFAIDIEKSGVQKLYDLLENLYTIQKLNTIDIGNMFNTSNVRIRSYLIRLKIKLRAPGHVC